MCSNRPGGPTRGINTNGGVAPYARARRTARDALLAPDGGLEGQGAPVLRRLREGAGAHGSDRPVRDEQLPGAPVAGTPGPHHSRHAGEVSSAVQSRGEQGSQARRHPPHFFVRVYLNSMRHNSPVDERDSSHAAPFVLCGLSF